MYASGVRQRQKVADPFANIRIPDVRPRKSSRHGQRGWIYGIFRRGNCVFRSGWNVLRSRLPEGGRESGSAGSQMIRREKETDNQSGRVCEWRRKTRETLGIRPV